VNEKLASSPRLQMTDLKDADNRHRHGEPIATGFVESAVNQVVSKRLVKKQQMRWPVHIGCSRCEPACSINIYVKTSNAGIRSYESLPIPFAWPRSTRIGPLSFWSSLVLSTPHTQTTNSSTHPFRRSGPFVSGRRLMLIGRAGNRRRASGVEPRENENGRRDPGNQHNRQD
jgi:hypothetical protein